MNTYTKSTLALLGFGLAVFVGTAGVTNVASAVSVSEIPVDATTDETYFIQKVFRLSDRRIVKMSPVQLDVSPTETTTNAIIRTEFSRELNNGKTQALGDMIVVDLGKTGHPSSISVTRGAKGVVQFARFQRMANGDWVAVSTLGKDSRTLTVPAVYGVDGNNMRLNGHLIAALDAIERTGVIGRKNMNFTVVSYTDDGMGSIGFTINPVCETWTVPPKNPWPCSNALEYAFVNGVLQ